MCAFILRSFFFFFEIALTTTTTKTICCSITLVIQKKERKVRGRNRIKGNNMLIIYEEDAFVIERAKKYLESGKNLP